MSREEPVLFCEDQGGKTFWHQIILSFFHKTVGLHCRYLPFLCNLDVAKIIEEIRITVGFNRSFYIFIVDADIWRKKGNDLEEKRLDLIGEIENYDKLKGKIELVFLLNCLESLVCSDLAALTRCGVFHDVAINDEIEEEIHDPEKNIHCPNEDLNNYIKQHFGPESSWKKKIYPEKCAPFLDLERIRAKNRSFNQILTFLDTKFNKNDGSLA